MKNNPLFYTPSVARLYTQQGHLEKSAEIYAFLLDKDPENRDLRQALDDVNTRLSQPNPITDTGTPENRLETLVGTWVSLMVENNLRRKFENLRDSIKRFNPDAS